jgi:hypothetical protein
MRTNSFRYLFITVFSTALFSCKKDEANNAAASKIDLLTGKYWVITKYEGKTNTEPWTDGFPFFDACEKDDRWLFKKDGSIELSEGNDACSGNQPNQVLDELRWALLNNETKIEIDGKTMTIDQLDEKALVVSLNEQLNGVSFLVRISYLH